MTAPVKIERYAFGVSARDLVAGTSRRFDIEGSPDIPLDADNAVVSLVRERLAPIKLAPNTVVIEKFDLHGYDAMLSAASIDAWDWRGDSFNTSCRTPNVRLEPGKGVKLAGRYTGVVPQGLVAGDKFSILVTVRGKSKAPQ